jgi:hypothetical protein
VNWFRLWTPPPDPDKPPCPYQPGFSVDIRAHVPPPPFGHHRYGPNPRPCVPDGFLKTTTQSALVMAYPPLEGPGPLSSSATASLTARLTILEPLAVADGRGAQLVVCTVSTVSDDSDNKKPFEAVAKIFDPLYYSLADNFVPSVPADVTRQADSDYSCEAAAYEHLQTVRAGGEADRFSPAYHGSWTFSLPITIQRDENGDENESKTLRRSVRLVLMERIAGPSIRNLCLAPDGPPYDSAYRLEILARVLDGAVRQVHAGLEQRDLAARNVILADDDDNDDDDYDDNKVQQKYPRPVLVDYNISLAERGDAPARADVRE